MLWNKYRFWYHSYLSFVFPVYVLLISVSTKFSESKENWTHWDYVYEWLLNFSCVVYFYNMDWIFLWTEWSKLNEAVMSAYEHHHWNFCWGSLSGIFDDTFWNSLHLVSLGCAEYISFIFVSGRDGQWYWISSLLYSVTSVTLLK